MADNQIGIKFTGDATQLTASVNQANRALGTFGARSKAAGSAVLDFNRIIQDSPFGLVGITNNIDQFSGSLGRLRQESRETGRSIGSLLLGSLSGGGGLALAVSAVTAALTFASVGFGAWTRGLVSSTNEVKKSNTELLDYRATLESVGNEIGRDASRVTTLVSALQSNTLNLKQRAKALDELKKINVEFFGGLKDEKGVVEGLQTAYDGYIGRLKEVGRQKAIETQLTKLFSKKLELELKLDANFGAATSPETLANLGRLRKRLEELGGAVDTRELSTYWELQKDGSLLVNKNIQERQRLQQQISELERGGNRIVFDRGGLIAKELELIDRQIKGLIGIQDITKNFDVTEKEIKGTKEAQTKEIEKQISAYDRLKKGLLDIKNASSLVGTGPADTGTPVEAKNITGQFTPESAKREAEQIRAYYTTLSDAVDSGRRAIQEGVRDAFFAIGDAFGSVLGSGGGIAQALAAAGQGLLGIIGGVLQQIGKQVILASTLVQKLQLALSQLFTPGGAAAGLAVGVGLVALGGLLKNIRLAKIPAFAEGGIVSGPTFGLVGEAGREAIIPLDRIGEVLGSIGGAQSVFVTGQLSGETIYLQQQRTGDRRGRFV